MAKLELAQMVRCVEGAHRGRVGFVLALGERAISVRMHHPVTGEFIEAEQQPVENWQVIQEPRDDVARRLDVWRITGRQPRCAEQTV